MSVDTLGFVAGDYSKDVWEVIAKVKKALKSFTTDEGPGVFAGRNVSSDVLAKFDIMSHCQGITCHFKEGKDSRILWIHFDCWEDNNDVLDGPKLLFSIGCWGNAEKIIKTVLSQFYGKGKGIYFCPNDCGDEWTKLENQTILTN